MSKNQLLKILSKAAFILSAILTAQLMLENAVGILASAITVGIVGILEYGKMFCATKSLEKNDDTATVKTIMSALAIFLFLVSIVASLTYLFNQENKQLNKQIINSDTYKRNVESYEDSKSSIARLQADIDSKKSSKQSTIKAESKELWAEHDKCIAKNWLTTPSGSPRKGADIWKMEALSQEKATRSRIDNEIKSLQNQIKMQENLKLSSKEDLENLKTSGVVATKGYTETFNAIANMLSSEDMPISRFIVV